MAMTAHQAAPVRTSTSIVLPGPALFDICTLPDILSRMGLRKPPEEVVAPTSIEPCTDDSVSFFTKDQAQSDRTNKRGLDGFPGTENQGSPSQKKGYLGHPTLT